MNLDDTRPTRYTAKVQVYPKNFFPRPDQRCRARRHIALSQGQCATCGAQLLLKYAHRTMCCRYACLKAAAAKRRARHADGSVDDAVAMCSASRSWRCLACTSAIPISSSQRSSATSWLLPTRPYATSRADRSKRTSIHRLLCVCLSLRLFVRTVWLEDCAQEEQRESEEEDAEAAIAEHEKDRSGLVGARRRRRKFGG